MRTHAYAAIVLAAIGAAVPAGAAPISQGTTTRVSPAVKPTGDSTYGAISAGGRYIAFDSSSALVSNDLNGDVDVYVRDMSNGAITLISPGLPGTRAFDPAITSDGSLIAYVVWGTGQGLYVHDLTAGSSVNLAPGRGVRPAISPDGRWSLRHDGIWIVLVDRATAGVITFRGDAASLSATNLVVFVSFWPLLPQDIDGKRDVYIRDLSTGALTLLTGDIDEEAVNPAISADGTTVLFESLPPMQIHPIRLHMLDLRSGQRTLITDGAEPYDLPTMSADGSVAAFASPGLMLAATSPAGTGPLTAPGIYVWERLTNTTTLVSVRSGGAPGPWAQPFVPEPNCFIPLADSVCIPFPPTPVKLGISASNPQISPDGRWVVFDSLQRLADDDIDESADVYVHDRW